MSVVQESPRFTRRRFLNTVAGGAAAVVVGSIGIDLLNRVKAEQDARRARAADLETKILEEFGISSPANLLDLRTIEGVEVGGGFIFGTGNFRGETKSILRFAWETNGAQPERLISNVPVDIVTWPKPLEGHENDSPTVQFITNPDSLFSGLVNDYRPRIDIGNPNNAVEKTTLVRITMSDADFTHFLAGQSTPQPEPSVIPAPQVR